MFYLRFDKADASTIKGLSSLLITFGLVFIIFSIFSYSVYGEENRISTGKFLLIFFLSFPLFIGGIILYRKAKYLASETLKNRFYRLLLYLLPLFVCLILIILVETVINCSACVTTTILAVLGFIIIGFFFVFAYIIYRHKRGLSISKLSDFIPNEELTSASDIKDNSGGGGGGGGGTAANAKKFQSQKTTTKDVRDMTDEEFRVELEKSINVKLEE